MIRIGTPTSARSILLATLLLAMGIAESSLGSTPDLLVVNATLIDSTGNGPDRTVNLHLEGGELTLVTEDEAQAESAELLDAGGGVLLGNLELNSRPSFLILDADPREDFNVILDTKTHVVFAIEDGEVRINELTPIEYSEPAKEKAPQWLAYTPPPFAVPVGYSSEATFNRFDNRYFSGIFTGALVLDRTNWLDQDAGSLASFGDLGAQFDGGEIRGLRGGIAGTINFSNPWIYVISGATNAFEKGFEIEDPESFAFFDVRVDIPMPGSTVLSVGKQKEPISMERLTGMVFLPMQERSIASDALFPARNVGVVLSGSGPAERSTWAVGAFNDWIETGDDFSDSASQLVGRATWAPSLSGDESNLLHLGLGYRYTNANEGQRYRSEPEIDKSVPFVDTGRQFESGIYEADGATHVNIEAAWRAGPFWLASEYFSVDTDAPDLGDPNFHGYYATASWALTGEMREYDRRRGLFKALPVARSTYNGGSGAVEASLRFSSVDLDSGAISGGKSDVASVGINWWLTPFFQVGVNYRHIWNELDGIDGKSSAINTRILLILE